MREMQEKRKRGGKIFWKKKIFAHPGVRRGVSLSGKVGGKSTREESGGKRKVKGSKGGSPRKIMRHGEPMF